MWILKWNLYSTSDKILSVKCILVNPWTTQFTIIHAFHILNKPRLLEFLKNVRFYRTNELLAVHGTLFHVT